ncbi:YkyA family protein [Virgibacillus soli]
MKVKKIHFFLIFCLLFILSGCGESVQEQIYNHLEEAVTLEKDFENQQNTLTKLENKEQAIYNELIDLPMDEFDEIKKLSKEAHDVIKERKEKITEEKSSIDASREEFKKVKQLIADLKEEKAKKVANNMYQKMLERYDAYDTFNKEYVQSLQLEEKLYDILIDKDSSQEQLAEHLDKLNNSYVKIIEANEQFNQFTNEYNDLKKNFYKEAELNVKYEDE